MKAKKIAAALTALAVMIQSMSCGVFAQQTYQMGDANMSGIITADDAALVLSYTLNRNIDCSDEQVRLFDVNASGAVTADDAALILQHVLTGAKFPADGGTETTTEAPTETTTEETTESTTEAPTEITTEETTEVSTICYDLICDELTEETTQYRDPITADAYTFAANAKVGEKEAECDGTTYTKYVQLNGAGGTTSANVSFYAPAAGSVTVIARSSNATQARNIVIANESGTVLAQADMPTGSDPLASVTFSIPSNGIYYIYGGMGNINIYRITYVGTGEVVTEATTETTSHVVTEPTSETTTIFSGDISDGVVVTDFASLKEQAAKTDVKIYIKGTIECDECIKLTNENANVEFYGLTNDDGTAATLDFSKLRDSRTAAGEGGAGFVLSGSKYRFTKLIVEKAGDCGIRITGSDNVFSDCVFRYNNNSGISLTKGGSNNSFYRVDSYRNADLVQKNGADADGFAVKIGAGDDNRYFNCRSWENSDDGWDSYDRLSDGKRYVGPISYVDCIAWNNGNPYVFTGEWDYEQGKPLDKNLIYVQQILKEDPDFEAKYNAHTVTSWPQVTLSLLGKTNTYDNIHSTAWAGNPNGFKFGSKDTPSTSYRYVKNCIAFGHLNTPNQTPAKGFDQNNGSASYDIENTVSFDNGQNYWVEKMTPFTQTGVFYSFDGGQDDLPGELKLTTPSAEKQAAIRAEVKTKVDYILDSVYSNKLPGEVICDVFN